MFVHENIFSNENYFDLTNCGMLETCKTESNCFAYDTLI